MKVKKKEVKLKLQNERRYCSGLQEKKLIKVNRE